MTQKQKHSWLAISSGVVLTALVAITFIAIRSVSAAGQVDRRFELVAQCMSFRLASRLDDSSASDNPMEDSSASDNPTLAVRVGDRIELTLRSVDRGMLHDLTIPGFQATTRKIAFGETTVIRFTASQVGSFDYFCTLHPRVMRGLIVVRN